MAAMRENLTSGQRVTHAKWKIAGYGAAIIGRRMAIASLIFIIIEIGKLFGGVGFSN
jgi:hypothetical protein